VKGKARTAGQRCFERLVYGRSLAAVELSELKPNHFAQWKRAVLEDADAASKARNPMPEGASGEKLEELEVERYRKVQASFNRSGIVPLAAALNKSFQRRNVASDFSWRQELKKFSSVDGQRKVYLNTAQRSVLLRHMSPEAAPFFTALCMLPVRPQVPAAMRVEHLDTATGLLFVADDKEHAGRSFSIGNGKLDFFRSQIKGKLPSAFIFMQANGKPWNGNAWQKHMREAVARVVANGGFGPLVGGAPQDVVAYSLRHSLVSDMANGGVPSLAVAKIAGTSVGQIEKHYYKMGAEESVRALDAVPALRLVA
jgi:integrase